MMNVLHIADFHRDWSELGLVRPMDWNINILQHPHRYRVDVLPQDIKERAKAKIERHLEWLRPLDTLTRATSGFEGIINFMMANDSTSQLPEFFKNNNLIDNVRNEDFFKVFPELYELKKYDPT
jgi:hypothetical protein